MDWVDGQGLGKNIIGKLVRKVFREEVCEQISLNGKDVPRYGTISWGYHPVTWWQVNCNGPLFLWNGQGFILTWVDINSGYRFIFCACNVSKLSSVNLDNTLSTILVFHKELLLSKKFTLQRSVTCVTMLLTILEQLA